jgi:hypothetical protein
MPQEQQQEWTDSYLGKRTDAYNEYLYSLRTKSVENVNAASAFDYVVQPVSLSIVKRSLRPSSSSLKQAAAGASPTTVPLRQSYEDWEEQKSLEASIGLGSPLGPSFSDYTYSITQEANRNMAERVRDELDQHITQQKFASFSQPGVRMIQGQNPVVELLHGSGEAKLIHSAQFQEKETFSRIEDNGLTHKTVIEFIQKGICANPRCGICNTHQQQKQKIASSNNISKELSSLAYKPAFMEMEEQLFGGDSSSSRCDE